MMGRHVFLTVLIVSILAVIVGILVPGQPREQSVNLPWQVELMADGSTQVFGLVLGKSTLQDAQQIFQEEAELSMFATDDGKRVVEGFFSHLTLSGLRAKMVVALDYSEQELAAIFDRGARISTLGSGSRKVTLSGDDQKAAMHTPIATITYLPKINLEAELVKKRFGQPAQSIKEQKTDVEHWLYPEKGLDIALSDEQKDVLQYTLPSQFENLVAPLKAH
jgi:hypothetical protein